MSSRNHEHLFIARIILEARSALSVSTGLASGIFDNDLVRDANGLPTLPGTTLAGNLRHCVELTRGQDAANRLFGFSHRNHKRSQASRVSLSHGLLLGSRGQVCESLCLDPQTLAEDRVWKAAIESSQTPVLRDRVRITHRGAASDEGKFDRSVLPRGHRFAFELCLWASEEEREPAEEDWQHLLAMLYHPLFRLGANTRSGLGRVEPVSIFHRRFVLSDPGDARSFRDLGRDLTDTRGLEEYQPPEQSHEAVGHFHLDLESEGYWRVGGGELSLREVEKTPDLLPKFETVLDPVSGKAKPMYILPASSVKGALAHRVAYYYNLLRERYADTFREDEKDHTSNPAVQALFGAIKNDEAATGGHAGRVFIEDIYIDPEEAEVGQQMHTAIDRFTGGVRDGFLFEEQMLWKTRVTIEFTLQDIHTVEADARRAFLLAIRDLANGRLALGAGANQGHGFFNGDFSLSEYREHLGLTEQAA